MVCSNSLGIRIDKSGIRTLNISGWNVSKVTNMIGMFDYADKLITLTTTTAFTPGVSTTGTNMSRMFARTYGLNTIEGITD